MSRALANLAVQAEIKFEIYQQGGILCLMDLMCSDDLTCQHYTSAAIQLLCTCFQVRKAIVKERQLGPFITLSSHHSKEFQYCASVVFCLLTEEESNRFYLATEALDSLLNLCSNHGIKIQQKAICSIANLADSLDTHSVLVTERTMQILKEIAFSCSDIQVVRNLVRFFASISFNNIAKDQILDQKLFFYLMKFSRHSDKPTQRFSSLAICNVCLHSNQKERIVTHDGLLNMLIFLTKCSDLEVELCSILSVAALALGAKQSSKQQILNSGLLYNIIKALQYPDIKMKQCSSLAFNSLIIFNKDLIESLMVEIESHLPETLFSILGTPDDECIHNAVYALGSLIENDTICQRFVDCGCIKSILDNKSSSSIEIKRACGYFFSVLVEYTEFHQEMANFGALRYIVHLASLVDIQCQLYASFCLVILASNPNFQVDLVNLGAVRHLVSMMTTELESQHYAGLALLKLADNFENHVKIAEEGGIQALLKLGRSRSVEDEVQYKAALTVGHLASKAVSNLPKFSNDTPNRTKNTA